MSHGEALIAWPWNTMPRLNFLTLKTKMARVKSHGLIDTIQLPLHIQTCIFEGAPHCPFKPPMYHTSFDKPVFVK